MPSNQPFTPYPHISPGSVVTNIADSCAERDIPEAPAGQGWSVIMLRLLLEERAVTGVLLAIGALYFLFFSMGLTVYQCPLQSSVGLACPGCGLSSALIFLIQGRFVSMWQAHPFAPYFALLFVLVLMAAVLPDHPRKRWISRILQIEERTRFHAFVLILFAGFGAARLLWQIVLPG